jgi:hypothetical protein
MYKVGTEVVHGAREGESVAQGIERVLGTEGGPRVEAIDRLGGVTVGNETDGVAAGA